MDNIDEKRKEFTRETIEHYSKNPRCTDDKQCYYSPKFGSSGCAIGRHLSLELSTQIDNENPTGIGIENVHIKYQIPEKLIELGINFLNLIQNLHDRDSLWSEDGLSDKGIKYLENNNLIL